MTDRHITDGDAGESGEGVGGESSHVPHDVPLQAGDEFPPGHYWSMIAQFRVNDEQMERLAAARLTPGANVPVELDASGLMSMDGPGCAKCTVHWSAGWGTECAADPKPGNGLVLPDHMSGRLVVPRIDVPREGLA